MRLAMMAAALAGAMTAAPARAEEPIQVMVIGTYHFGNPGHDIANVQAEDVTTPARQAELQKLAERLAGWRPTKVVVEAESADLTDKRYAAFSPETLRTQRNEIVQIGYRLARRMGFGTVYAIDESPSEGEPDYFPFDKVTAYAAAHDQQAPVDALLAFAQASTQEISAGQKQLSIPGLLAFINRPEADRTNIGAHYRLLGVGDSEAQPGADLNAMWYLRNAKIFAKLMKVAKPGDRVVVIYGSGHSYWLRHFARETPGYQNADPVPLLEQAAR